MVGRVLSDLKDFASLGIRIAFVKSVKEPATFGTDEYAEYCRLFVRPCAIAIVPIWLLYH